MDHLDVDWVLDDIQHRLFNQAPHTKGDISVQYWPFIPIWKMGKIVTIVSDKVCSVSLA